MVPAKLVSREEWLAARQALRTTEGIAIDARQRATEERRALPAVELDKPYVFEGPVGPASLRDLFEGRSTLIVYHFMFEPDWDQGCKMCSMNVDNIGHLAHFHGRDITFAVVSRAPLSKIAPFKACMGWTFPWYSSFGSDFNTDFHATVVEGTDPALYAYKSAEELERSGEYYFTKGEQGGTSVFTRDGDRVFHTYSSFGAESDVLNGTFMHFELLPDGLADAAIMHHDRYGV